MEKKKKILIGGIIAAVILMISFTFIILNYDNPQQVQKAEDVSVESQSTDETKGEGESEYNYPFEALNVNGIAKSIDNPKDFDVNEEGKLLIAEDLIEEYFGTNIYWQEGVLYIGNSESSEAAPITKYLSDQDYLKLENPFNPYSSDLSLYSNTNRNGNDITLAGETYLKGISIYSDYQLPDNATGVVGTIKYKLDGKATSLNTIVGIEDKYKNVQNKFTVRFYDDSTNQLLHEVKEFEAGSLYEEIQVPVTDVLALKIELIVHAINDHESVEFVLANPTLK